MTAEPPRPVIIVGCGMLKEETPRPAQEIFRGAHTRASIRWALSIGRLLILSAKHGLIPGEQVIAPYKASFSARYPEPGEETVTQEVLASQIASYGLSGAVPTLAGKDYRERLLAAGISPYNPFHPLLDAAGLPRTPGYLARVINEHHGRWPMIERAA